MVIVSPTRLSSLLSRLSFNLSQFLICHPDRSRSERDGAVEGPAVDSGDQTFAADKKTTLGGQADSIILLYSTKQVPPLRRRIRSGSGRDDSFEQMQKKSQHVSEAKHLRNLLRAQRVPPRAALQVSSRGQNAFQRLGASRSCVGCVLLSSNSANVRFIATPTCC